MIAKELISAKVLLDKLLVPEVTMFNKGKNLISELLEKARSLNPTKTKM